MPKVIFFFPGLGDDCIYYSQRYETSQFANDVIRIYIKGSQEKQVGNGFLFPNLDIAANNVRNAFEGNELDLAKLCKNFGGELYTDSGDLYAIRGLQPGLTKIKVDDITLQGFSRGAVTTFATAKKLDDLNIPMHIIANQPVPGEIQRFRSLYSRYSDLRACRNIRSAHTFLASYDLNQGIIHTSFFWQMVAKFAPEVNAQQILIPHQHHLDWFEASPIDHHINKIMAANGLIRPAFFDISISSWYKAWGHRYTPNELMLPIQGAEGPINKDPIYLDMIYKKAQDILINFNIDTQGLRNSEQASAIVAIHSLYGKDIDAHIIKLFELVLMDSRRAQQFIKVVNKVADVCNYLEFVTRDDWSNKSMLINMKGNYYKTSVFLASFSLLSKEKPSIQDKKQFASDIYKAECTFRDQALGIDRDIFRMVLKVLTNFITHITGVGLILNAINKANTGNWLLFQHNRSVNVVRDTRKALLNDMEQFDPEPASAPTP